MRITKETQALLGGQDRDVLALSLLQGETRKQVLTFKEGALPIDLTNYSFQFRMIERLADSITDTKNGLSISGLQSKPGAVEFNFDTEVTIVDAPNGIAQLYFPLPLTTQEPTDPDSEMPLLYTGYLSINDGASQAALNQKVQILVTVSNDGV